MENREMYAELTALLGSITKALDLGDGEAAKALESGAMAMTMGVDENGRNFIRIRYGTQAADIYQGGFRRVELAPEDTQPAQGCGCGGGKCG